MFCKWTISGQLKIAADRLYAELECLGYEKFAKDFVLIMKSGGGGFAVAEAWYNNYERNLGWRNLGKVLGSGNTEKARKLGWTIL